MSKKLTKLEKRLKNRVRNKVIFVYTRPANRKFVETQAAKKKINFSEFVDSLITKARNRKSLTTTTTKSG